jgi:hypothetical protein
VIQAAGPTVQLIARDASGGGVRRLGLGRVPMFTAVPPSILSGITPARCQRPRTKRRDRRHQVLRATGNLTDDVPRPKTRPQDYRVIDAELIDLDADSVDGVLCHSG